MCTEKDNFYTQKKNELNTMLKNLKPDLKWRRKS